jgi:predicted negative regulator of RcsB-dependent stress response
MPQPTRSADRVETFIDWFRVRSRYIAIGAAAVVVALAGYWLYTRQQIRNAERADTAYRRAQQAYFQGNQSLALTDLTSLVKSRGGTPAGVQGAMLLAQLHYERGEYPKGVDALRSLPSSTARERSKPAVESLIGDGLSMENKPADAAAAYQRAAEAADQPGERAYHLAKRARALMAANQADEARKLWTELATNPDYSAVAGEARVRLGELEAKPAGRS